MAAGDTAITWLRRPRGLGEWLDGEDVPQVENTERYEVDILADDGETVVRTIETTTESATYTAADRSSDFVGAYVLNIPKIDSPYHWTRSTGMTFSDLGFFAQASGTASLTVSLVGRARPGVIDGGVQTFSLSGNCVTFATAGIAIGLDFLDLNGTQLGTASSSFFTPGTGGAVASFSASIPAFSRQVTLRVIANGENAELETPLTAEISTDARPIQANIYQLGANAIRGQAKRVNL